MTNLNYYSRPILVQTPYYELTKPAIVMIQSINPVVPNSTAIDLYLDTSCKLTLIDGPNGSGKTTLLSTIALNLILA